MISWSAPSPATAPEVAYNITVTNFATGATEVSI